MAFFKFRWPGQSEPAPADKPAKRSRAAPPAESIEAMRRRARHRLIGAAVLVALGVVGFPLLFDTQPRPIAVDIPIEIPDRNKTAPVVVPAPAPAAAQAPSPAPASAAVARQAAPAAAPAAPSGSRSAPTGQGNAGNGLSEGEEIIASPRPALVPKPPAVAAAPKPEHKPEPKPEPRPAVVAATPAPAPAAPARANDEAARARALLEGRTAAPAVAAAAASASAEDARFIVQVGAFADADKAREARTKVERSGLKTFVQVVDTKDGKRTRVRVGPFNNRADADKAAGKIRSLELSASVLTL